MCESAKNHSVATFVALVAMSLASSNVFAGGLLDIEFVVQLGLLLNAAAHPDIVKSTELTDQLEALHECGWINTNNFNILNKSYQQLTLARQKMALMAEDAGIHFEELLGISQSLCSDILS